MSVQVQDRVPGTSLARQLAVILLTAVFSVGMFLYVFQKWMNTFYDRVQEQRRRNLTQLVSVARNAVEPIVIQVRSGEPSAGEALERVRQLVRTMTYSDQYGQNYIFMSGYDGTLLVQPFEPEKEMSNQWDLRDAHGLFSIRELVGAAREHPRGSFVNYYYQIGASLACGWAKNGSVAHQKTQLQSAGGQDEPLPHPTKKWHPAQFPVVGRDHI